MTEPVWVPLAAAVVIHDRQIALHGGGSGTRDQALLEMGWARAMNLAAYTEAELAEIAAAYVLGIAKAHAFVDGNKRTAFVMALTFLRLNDFAFRPSPVEGVRMIDDLAAGQVSQGEFAKWLANGMTPI